MRRLSRTDLFFLLWWVCGREDCWHQFILDRCREVEERPDGHIDLWAREHYKSTIITFGKTLQDILASHGEEALYAERTFGIFSHTRPIAKGFLRQIKRELESNTLLKALFPDVVWENARRDAPTWSEDSGIVVQRQGNPKEATVEAWGLVDGQPTSKHFTDLIYDDVVTKESVSTPDMINKTTAAVELSYNLGAMGGRRKFVGTRYHFSDTYKTIMERESAKPRIYPATVDASVTGEPVLMEPDELALKRRDMGPYVFGCQMLLDPKSEQVEGFKSDWLDYWSVQPVGGNRYIVVDPANEKKKKSDYTAAWVIELMADQKYYCVDMVRDRLNLTERANLLFNWHKQYASTGTLLGVGYEQYGMQADIEHFEDRMRRENYRFHITPLGGTLGKNERIKRLIPLFEQQRILLPPNKLYVNYENQQVDLVHAFTYEEYVPFPVGGHDDMLDSLARILDEDLHTEFPPAYVQPMDMNFPSEF